MHDLSTISGKCGYFNRRKLESARAFSNPSLGSSTQAWNGLEFEAGNSSRIRLKKQEWPNDTGDIRDDRESG